MKDFVQKAAALIMFDLPADPNYIREKFIITHSEHQRIFPGWSTNSTRQKLVASYWFEDVSKHFVILFSIPALALILTSTDKLLVLGVVLVVGFISFAVLWSFHYRPIFLSFFLPNLELVKEILEQKQLEQLEKCKRAQLSNPTLVLIYYVFDKVSGINALQCNDRQAELLMKLYGVDQGSLKKNLELILGKKKSLTERKYTEIANRFVEARGFFEDLQFKEGQKILDELEQKFKA